MSGHLSYEDSIRAAREARTVEQLRDVLRDIAERALRANSAVAVDSIRSIAEAASRRSSERS